MKEIIFAGSGGQGVLTSGLIISDIAASEGIHVTWVPSYGSLCVAVQPTVQSNTAMTVISTTHHQKHQICCWL